MPRPKFQVEAMESSWNKINPMKGKINSGWGGYRRVRAEGGQHGPGVGAHVDADGAHQMVDGDAGDFVHLKEGSERSTWWKREACTSIQQCSWASIPREWVTFHSGKLNHSVWGMERTTFEEKIWPSFDQKQNFQAIVLHIPSLEWAISFFAGLFPRDTLFFCLFGLVYIGRVHTLRLPLNWVDLINAERGWQSEQPELQCSPVSPSSEAPLFTVTKYFKFVIWLQWISNEQNQTFSFNFWPRKENYDLTHYELIIKKIVCIW